ncbi:alpha-(1,3)-fucosyltransferase 10 isoform X2 [Eurytemora carolleeae]|uniref:alpha-(1,3)-fucosyltransferase 10 isoform X2 n=1 Tax=Eurytemora carolleeae TaxID=1294199 RepID=UPI000C77D0BC|nr:alpha-(1,3)-fucosyltransferase 10 isoform X2 [Eurytemora carolleeae]|eukprot:XP_023323942.1 alpha-(1,3)-fucosyltransferase 10-like isoform X2 [Eurytemora affinis]
MLYLLMRLKMKTIFSIFSFLLLLFFLIYLKYAVQQFFNPKVLNAPLKVLDNSVFAEEIGLILEGKKVDVSFPDIPVMVWWTSFTGDDGLQECDDGKSCFVTNDRKYMKHPNLANIFFYGTDFREYDLPLPRTDVHWSLLHEESPKNNQIFSHADMMSLFNHSSTFRKESDLALTTQYLEGLSSLIDDKYTNSFYQKNRLAEDEGLAPVVYVQSGCDTPSNRDIWVQEFMKYIQVDSLGSCLTNKDLPGSIRGSENMQNSDFYAEISKYKFMLTLENAVCPDYITEKLWRALQLGVIPIYLGAPNVDEYLPNPTSIISIQLYMQYMKHKTLKKVENQYLRHLLSERSWGVSVEDQMEKGNSVKHFQCLVCTRIHRSNKFKNMGFSSAVYRATKEHYGCPVPVHPITKQVDYSDRYVQDYFRMKYSSAIIKNFSEKGARLPGKVEFNDLVLDKWKTEFMKWNSNKD